MSLDANQLYAKLVSAGNDWADKEAAFNVLDDTRHSVLAKIMLSIDATSVAAREMEAKASREYIEHVENTQQAKAAAIKAKVQYDSIKIWIDMRRSEEATRRAEMKL